MAKKKVKEVKKITLTRALAEVKLLDKKINSKTSKLRVVDVQEANETIDGLPKGDYAKNVAFELQALNDLIIQKTKLKSKIMQANATTKLNIGDVEYTILEAIQMKTDINYNIAITKTINSQLSEVKSRVDYNNENLEDNIQQTINAKASSNSSSKTFASDIRESMEKIAKVSVGNGVEMLKVLEKRTDAEELFLHNVDFALSEINSTTFIEL